MLHSIIAKSAIFKLYSASRKRLCGAVEWEINWLDSESGVGRKEQRYELETFKVGEQPSSKRQNLPLLMPIRSNFP